MSAWIVSDRHIDYLVTAIVHAELAPHRLDTSTDPPVRVSLTPDEIGRMLWRECLESVACRYPDDKDGDRPGPAGFRDSDVGTYTWHETPVLTGGDLDKTVGCYQYQSCEHPGWETSQARFVTNQLREPVKGSSWAEESEVPWGWPSRSEVPS